MNSAPRIQAIGDFYPQDAEGYVLNRCAEEKVGQEWWPLIHAVVDEMRAQWAEKLVGVYLRGSVPAGTAVAGISDLDAFALLNWAPGELFLRWEEPDWAPRKALDLQKAWPVASSVELMCASHDPAVPGQNPRIKMVLKTQSLCVWGHDVLSDLPACRPGREMMIHHRWFPGDWARFREKGWAGPQEVRSLMKLLIRTGFELVMEREGRYASDLYPCMQAFVRHYPRFAEGMEEALRIFLEPGRLARELPPPLEKLAEWMAAQVAGLA